MGDFFKSRIFEYIFISLLVSIIILLIAKKVNIAITPVNVVIAFLNPILVFSVATIGGASEIWFTLVTLIGTFFVIKFYFQSKLINLINLYIACSFFSFAYLIRPEGLAYFASTLYALCICIGKDRQSFNIKVGLNCAGSVLMPIIIIIVPYLYFLYATTGEFTISGKSSYNRILVEPLFSTPFQKYTTNLFQLFRVLFAPYFIGPLIIFLVLINMWAIFTKKIKFQSVDVILIAPVPIIFIAMLQFLPWARALFSSIPVFMIFAFRGLDFLNERFGIMQKKQTIISTCIFFFQLAIIISPIILGKFDNNPQLYYQAVNFLNADSTNKKISVYSREGTLSLFNKNILLCTELSKCIDKIDYFLLSNIEHDKIGKKSAFEITEIKNESFAINDTRCNKTKEFSRGLYILVVFKCD